MSNDPSFKQTAQNRMVYTDKGEFGRPFISIIIAEGDREHTDDLKWSFPVQEIKSNYKIMKEHFTSWFYDEFSGTTFYIDEAHKQKIIKDGGDYYDSDYLWNRLFVEDQLIANIIRDYEPPLFNVMSGSDLVHQSKITRTKTVIFRYIDGAGYFQVQVSPQKYTPYKYTIHTLGDEPYGEDVSKEFFKWFNHMREKGWFTMEHLNNFIDVVERNWKLPFTSIR